MKNVKDHFSGQSVGYRKFRPTYPKELYGYLLSLLDKKNSCWDCGTGNGQVASALSPYFKKIAATDISEAQLRNAINKPNIVYSIQRAEKTTFQDQQFNLITVAQAVHWFDFKAFNKEAKRVLKPDGVLALWGYGLLRIDPEIDEIITAFYKNKVGAYWYKERKYIDDGYRSVIFDFKEIKNSPQFKIQLHWDLDHFLGYVNTWSSVQNYKGRNNGNNPVDELGERLKPLWNAKKKKVEFPVFMRIGKK